MGASQGNDPAWLGLLDSIRIDQQGAEVRLTGTVSRAMLQSLAGRMTSAGAPDATAPPGTPAQPGTATPAN